MNKPTFKERIKRLKYLKKGIDNMTLSQRLYAKIAGLYGAVIGLAFATIYMILFKGMWYLGLFMVCLTFLQSLELNATKQNYRQAKEIEKAIKTTGAVKNGF